MSQTIKCSNDRVILGIDPGTGRMGWGIIRLKIKDKKLKIGGPELVDCGLIETPAKTSLVERLTLIFDELQQIIKKYSPTEMAIEELFFVKNVKTGISVAHARGVVMLAGSQNGLEISEYKPNEIKLAIAGHGHADKAQMKRMLKLHLKECRVKQDDTVDAIAAAVCHLQIRKFLNHNL